MLLFEQTKTQISAIMMVLIIVIVDLEYVVVAVVEWNVLYVIVFKEEERKRGKESK